MHVIDAKCLNNSDPVVIVDDSHADLTIAERVYKRSELKNPLITFTSGKLFLEHMEKVKQGGEVCPVMVLMDINMPGMNGFETIQALRSYAEFMEIPVIVMLTNSDSMQDVEKSVQVGANGFHTKDFRISNYVQFFNSLKADAS